MAKFAASDELFPEELRDRFKYEIAAEVGIAPQIENNYWGGIASRHCGRVGGIIGGNMVKVMIRHAEEALKD